MKKYSKEIKVFEFILPEGADGRVGAGLSTGAGFKRLGRGDVTMQTDAPPPCPWDRDRPPVQLMLPVGSSVTVLNNVFSIFSRSSEEHSDDVLERKPFHELHDTQQWCTGHVNGLICKIWPEFSFSSKNTCL